MICPSSTPSQLASKATSQHLQKQILGEICCDEPSFTTTALILLYPFLALCLASSWAKNDYQGKLLGDYILNHIESKVGANNIGWQHYRKSASTGQFNLYFFGTRTLFIGTELLAMLLGISLGRLNGLTITLLIVAIISIFLTIIILINDRDYSKGSFSPTDIEAYIKKLLKRP